MSFRSNPLYDANVWYRIREHYQSMSPFIVKLQEYFDGIETEFDRATNTISLLTEISIHDLVYVLRKVFLQIYQHQSLQTLTLIPSDTVVSIIIASPFGRDNFLNVNITGFTGWNEDMWIAPMHCRSAIEITDEDLETQLLFAVIPYFLVFIPIYVPIEILDDHIIQIYTTVESQLIDLTLTWLEEEWPDIPMTIDEVRSNEVSITFHHLNVNRQYTFRYSFNKEMI